MWKKRNKDIDSIRSAVEFNSGCSFEELSKTERPSHRIDLIDKAAETLRESVEKKKKIGIIADYDADGVCSAAILQVLLRDFYHANTNVVIPKRIQDGYGAKPCHIDLIGDCDLVIMVDNGITCFEAVDYAKSKGMKVIILDHHLAGPEGIPDADIVIDPSAIEGSADSPYYCGAGLSLNLVLELIPESANKSPLAKKIKRLAMSLAGIATIADCVPLLGDNRWIVRQAAHYMKTVPNSGLRSLCKLSHLSCAYESKLHPGVLIGDPWFFPEDVAFKIAPCLNAPGRLNDEGARLVFETLSSIDVRGAIKSTSSFDAMAQELIALNEQRKDVTKKWLPVLESKIGDTERMPLCVFVPKMPKGLVGIFAGRLAEKHQMPCAVFTDDENDSEILHGSARSYGDIDIKAMLDENQDILEKFGGHAGAAGITVRKENFSAMCERFVDSLKGKAIVNDFFYDLEISEDALPEIVSELDMAWPYGKGNPEPILKINHKCQPTTGGFITRLGAEKEHMKISMGDNCSGIGFYMSSKFDELGQPRSIIIYGTVGKNLFQGVKSNQFQIEDFEPWEEGKVTIKTPLAQLLINAAKAK